MNLLLLDPAEIDASGLARLSGPRARHLLDVLRVGPGQDVRLGVIDAAVGTGTIVAVEAGVVTLRCDVDGRVEPRPPVDVLLALPRPKVMHRLWAQLAALGVGRILVSNAARVERNYFDTHVLDADVYRPLLLEGLQQARATRLPIVSVHRRLKVLVEDDLGGLFPGGVRLMAQPGAEPAIGPAARALAPGRAGERVLVAIGPEGGWTDYEQQLLATHGFQAVGMGGRTLRSDTACVALLALIHDALST